MKKSEGKRVKKTSKKKDDNTVKLDEEINKNIENLEKEIVNKKKLPKEEENKINKKVFENILIANIIMIFLYLISLGSLNIETPVFMTDLKVFSVTLIVFTILLFEHSYRKENANICIHGIECLILAIFTLLSTYLYTIYLSDFYLIVSIASFLFAIYYVGKSILIYMKMRKKYFESINDISEIIKK